MSKVELNLLNIFWLTIKKKTLEYEGKNVGDIISQFIKEHKKELDNDMLLNKNKKKLNPEIIILLNGKDVNYMKNYRTRVKEGDKIYLSAPLSGG